MPEGPNLIWADIEGKLVAHLRQRSPNVPASKRSTKRSITIKGHKTSVSLENQFWDCLTEIAVERGVTLRAVVTAIDANRQHANLSAAIRIFVLQFYRYQLQTRTAPLSTPPGDTAINERPQP